MHHHCACIAPGSHASCHVLQVTKTVKIQRLVTPSVLQRKRRRAALKRAKIDKARSTAVVTLLAML